jgi:hypothetical protein
MDSDTKYFRNSKGALQVDNRTDGCRHDYCEMVLSNNRELGALSEVIKGQGDDIKHIRKKVDNGLSEQMTILSNKLNDIEKNSWLVKILNKGATSLILFVLGAVILTGSASAGIWGLTRIFYFKESPGQMRQISDTVMSNGYILHTTLEGHKIMTANDPNKPAWIFCTDGNQWKAAPQYRVINKGGK